MPYPTKLVQLVTDKSERDASKDMPVGAGEAVLTRSANTLVQVEKGREAFLYSNTFVRFDDLNVWLLRNGAMYVVNKRGRLEVVAEPSGASWSAARCFSAPTARSCSPS